MRTGRLRVRVLKVDDTLEDLVEHVVRAHVEDLVGG
jgi:hypothetical protein